MNRIIRHLIAAVLAVTAMSAAGETSQHYAIDLNDFTELKVTDDINVDYVWAPDSAGFAVFDAPASMASRIIFVPSGSKLSLQLAPRDLSDPNSVDGPVPTVRVYSRYLASVENNGDSLVRVLSVAPGPKLKAKLVGNGRLSVRNADFTEINAQITTGNGTITLTGRCDTAVLGMLATGTITADGLKATDVKCRLTGTGTIGCSPSRKLEVRGIGSGKVYYTGQPEISKRAPGISVQPLD